MCGGSDAPAPPDPEKTAAAQAKYNEQAALAQARINAVDQYGPMGSTTYERNPDGSPKSQTVNLSPQMQSWLDSQFGASTKLQNATSKQLDYLPTDKFQLPTGPSATDYARNAYGADILDTSKFSDTGAVAQASYDQAKSMFEPDLAQARKQNEVTLAQRGIKPGDEIYRDEMDRLERGANNAYTQAGRQATLDAGAEQSRRANLAGQANTFGQNQYQTNLGNTLLERQQPFQEASALMGNTPQFGQPSFMQTGQNNVASPDYIGASNTAYQGQLANWQADQQKWSSIAGLAGTAGKAAMMMSDEDLKEDRHASDGEGVLAAFREMPVDDYRYKDDAQAEYGLPEQRTGPMAQDWAQLFDNDNGAGDGPEQIDIGDYLGKLASAVKALEARTARAA